VGAAGGHGPIRYTVEGYQPRHRVVFRSTRRSCWSAPTRPSPSPARIPVMLSRATRSSPARSDVAGWSGRSLCAGCTTDCERTSWTGRRPPRGASPRWCPLW